MARIRHHVKESIRLYNLSDKQDTPVSDWQSPPMPRCLNPSAFIPACQDFFVLANVHEPIQS